MIRRGQSLCAPAVLLAAGLLLAGCSLPGSWRPWGTPIEKAEKREAQESSARQAVLGSAQAAVHQAGLALDEAPPSREVTVASDFVAEAQTLLDQTQGAPTAGDVQKWQALVDRLLSENTKTRADAEREREKSRATVAAAADKLAAATAARVRAEQQVREYAKDNERLADLVRKAAWIGGLVLALWLASQALALAARFNPALSGLSTAFNMVAAPAVQFTAQRAQDGLQRVGQALATVRTQLPAVADQVIQHFDAATDRDHQQEISRAAKST